MIRILVDDIRDLGSNVDIIFRNPAAALKFWPRRDPGLACHFQEEIKLFLDHDMGLEFDTGHAFIKKLLSMDQYSPQVDYVWPQEVIIVSDNPVGVMNIENALFYSGYLNVNRMGRWIKSE